MPAAYAADASAGMLSGNGGLQSLVVGTAQGNAASRHVAEKL